MILNWLKDCTACAALHLPPAASPKTLQEETCCDAKCSFVQDEFDNPLQNEVYVKTE